MLRKEREAVPEGNGPVPQKKEFGSRQPTWGDVYRMIKEALYVCMYVFIKLHITTQSGPVILVILCHSH